MKKTYEKTVFGFHIDVFGHVHSAHYIEFYEEARFYIYEDIIKEIIKSGYAFAIVNININYRNELTYGERVLIDAQLERIGTSSFVIKQTMINAETDTLCSDMELTIVLINKETRKLVPIKNEVKILIEKLRT